MTSIHTNITQTTEGSPVRNELLNELREQVHDIIRNNQRNHIYFANNNLFRNININQTNRMDSREDQHAWGNPSFREEFYSRFSFSAEQEELFNALISDVNDTAREHHLDMEQLMILLSVDAYEILSRGRRHLERICGADVHVVDDQIDLYKVVVKGPRGFYIAERKVRALREEEL